MNWNSIIEGTSAGVAASILLGIFSISRDFIRDWTLRFRIANSFCALSSGSSIYGVTIGISNKVGNTYQIRSVVMRTNSIDHRLNATGDVKTSFDGQFPKPSKEQLRMLKEGKVKTIELKGEVQYGSWRMEPSRDGFVTIEPFTSHTFILPAQAVTQITDEIEEIGIVVQYTNRSGSVKILEVSVPNSKINIQSTVEHYKREILSGRLNHARKSFGLDPIVVPVGSPDAGNI